MPAVAVVDYGAGNLRSVEKALAHVAGPDWDVRVTSDADWVSRADRVVFPGQGAITDCMLQLRAASLESVVAAAAREKPFLGICIGLQALMEASDEDPGAGGLALFPGRCRRFADGVRDPVTGERLKVPHMGWNNVEQVAPHPLWAGIDSGERFYFVHSYFVDPADPALVTGRSDYAETFTAAIADGPLFAVQFHPEKSQRAGLKLLENFLAWRP